MRDLLAKKTPTQIREMAKRSALHTVRQLGEATAADVVREQGLSEFNARRALRELVRSGRCGIEMWSGRCWYHELKDEQ
jgi:hypothetical protein